MWTDSVHTQCLHTQSPFHFLQHHLVSFWGKSPHPLKLKLKLQYFGYLMRRADSLEKTLMLEKIEGRRRRG